MVKRRPKKQAVFLVPIKTARFVLRPVGRFEAWKLLRHIYADPELLGNLKQKKRPPSAWRLWRTVKRANGRTRVHHAIELRESGKVIGYHYTGLINYRTATVEIVIFDRSWWGQGVVGEIRKALIATLFGPLKLQAVTGQVHARNFASILNYRKLGFEHTGTIYSASFDELRDQPADFLLFSLYGQALSQKATEWQNERQRDIEQIGEAGD